MYLHLCLLKVAAALSFTFNVIFAPRKNNGIADTLACVNFQVPCVKEYPVLIPFEILQLWTKLLRYLTTLSLIQGAKTVLNSPSPLHFNVFIVVML